MTSQTKRFIELCDILALRFECKGCHSELLISSLLEVGKRDEQGKLSNCPVCRKPWASISGSTCELVIADFIRALNGLRNLIGNHEDAFPAGFLMTLEIRDERYTEPERA